MTFTNNIIDVINRTIKYIFKYTDKKIFSVNTEGITKDSTVGLKKQIVWSCDIFTDKMTNGVTGEIILLVIPSIIFNL